MRPASPGPGAWARLWTGSSFLLGAALVPVGLSGLTSWVLLPGVAGLAVVLTLAVLGEGLGGRPGGVALWSGWGLLVGAALALSLQSGPFAGGWGWRLPLAAAIGLSCWSLAVGALAGRIGRVRFRQRARRAVAARQARLEAAGPG